MSLFHKNRVSEKKRYICRVCNSDFIITAEDGRRRTVECPHCLRKWFICPLLGILGPAGKDVESPDSGGASTGLRLLVIINLIACFVGGYVIMDTYGQMEVAGEYYSETVSNPVAYGIGIGLIVEGILVAVFGFVFSSISDDLKVIRRRAEKIWRPHEVERSL